jgi:predicted transcriptional regulator
LFGYWTFLSNHAHVLVCLARNPDIRSRQVADLVGITERQVFKIISDLEESGVVKRIREGRRNHYEFCLDNNLRHPLEEHKTVRDLMKMLLLPEECASLGI